MPRSTAAASPPPPLEIVGESEHTGTTITFKPDDSIFTVSVYDYSTLANRLRDLAFLNAGITLHLTDCRELDAEGNYRSETFYSRDGLREFVQYIDSNKESLINDVIHLIPALGIPVRSGPDLTTPRRTRISTPSSNNINTIEGGTHLTGFRRAPHHHPSKSTPKTTTSSKCQG